MPTLVLASSSRYRRVLLERLQHPFECVSPNIDESPAPGELPEHLVKRLSEAKAKALAMPYPNNLIVGSDQVAVFEGGTLTKPGNYDAAFQQLRSQSGSRITFHTGVALLNSRTGDIDIDCISTDVLFRQLSDEDIADYLTKDTPYDCAGSFKCEGLGITLFEGIYGSDPTALVGLPLIRLSQMLRQQNL
ncbi:MAG: Maf family nucleotide pyrophosphatase [Porticoccus sp.]